MGTSQGLSVRQTRCCNKYAPRAKWSITVKISSQKSRRKPSFRHPLGDPGCFHLVPCPLVSMVTTKWDGKKKKKRINALACITHTFSFLIGQKSDIAPTTAGKKVEEHAAFFFPDPPWALPQWASLSHSPRSGTNASDFTNPVKEPSSYQLWSHIYLTEAPLICLHPINIFLMLPLSQAFYFWGYQWMKQENTTRWESQPSLGK